MESQNDLCWQDLKDHPVPHPAPGQGQLPLELVVPSPIQPNLEHFRGIFPALLSTGTQGRKQTALLWQFHSFFFF